MLLLRVRRHFSKGIFKVGAKKEEAKIDLYKENFRKLRIQLEQNHSDTFIYNFAFFAEIQAFFQLAPTEALHSLKLLTKAIQENPKVESRLAKIINKANQREDLIQSLEKGLWNAAKQSEAQNPQILVSYKLIKASRSEPAFLFVLKSEDEISHRE